MHGTFLWNELLTRDIEGACRFYAETLGWSYEHRPNPDGTVYVVAIRDGKPVAGLYDISDPQFQDMPPHWFAYVGVDDVDATMEKALAAGATTIRAPFEVPEVGRIALVFDPTGAALGWYTPVSHKGGTTV